MSALQLELRRYADLRSFIGGSDARVIMGNDEAALVHLWREKRGEAEPEDLSGNLVVQLGRATRPGLSGKEVLAMCAIRRTSAPNQCGTTACSP